MRRHLERGLEAPAYGPRAPQPTLIEPFEGYLAARVAAWPELSGKRLLREIREMGYAGGYTRLTDFLREVRPPRRPVFERRFETPPGRQGQVDFAEFKVEFADAPGVVRKVWLFTMVLGHSRWLWGRFCAAQDLQTVLRCHIEAFAAMEGAPGELLYDRMKTAVIGEDAEGVVNYNVSLVALLSHYGALPRACRPYRAKTKGKVERFNGYLKGSFLVPLAASLKAAGLALTAEVANLHVRRWLDEVANQRVHGTTGAVPAHRLIEERAVMLPAPALKAPACAPLRVVPPLESLQHPLGVYDELLDPMFDELLAPQP